MAETVVVVGFGSMGSALVTGCIRASVLTAKQVTVVDPDAAVRERAEQIGCKAATDLACAADADMVVLAVKPQSFPEVALSIGLLKPGTLVISVMAGVSTTRLIEAFGAGIHSVRCMPNVAAQVGLAVTTYTAAAECSDANRARALRVLGSIGSTVEIPEHLFDAATATSGSGPAYLFLLAESMIESAMRLGFDRPTADRLVRQSLLGASTLLARGDRNPAELRGMVTSQGGTTSAAMAVFESHGFQSMMHNALRAARDRGRDLAAAAARQSAPPPAVTGGT